MCVVRLYTRSSHRSLPPSASFDRLDPANVVSPISHGNMTQQASFSLSMSPSTAFNAGSSAFWTALGSPGGQTIPAKSPNVDRKGQLSSSASRSSQGPQHLSTRATRKKPEYDGFQMSECTFSPKINRVKPHMTTANEYLSESNVVDRLLRGPPGPASPIEAMYVCACVCE
jgi:hypothetical protein